MWRLNESPSEKEGKCPCPLLRDLGLQGLNESPSEKEGKCKITASKVASVVCLNESPSEKEGKSGLRGVTMPGGSCLNESPSEKEGKYACSDDTDQENWASMKVPPKRKGNQRHALPAAPHRGPQ